jgi:putative peptidoglycan lipid II flippase
MIEAEQVKPQQTETAGHVARSTLIVMAGFAISIVLGLVRQRAISTAFGTGSEYDAFFAANAIPELLFNVLAGGALAFAFIPMYTDLLTVKEPARAFTLFSQVLNLILVLAAIASLIAALLAPVLVTAPWGVAPDFAPAKQALTIQLMQILLLTTVIFAASSILSGTLQAHLHFILPALAPSFYTAGIIFGAIVLVPRAGVQGLAWGAVIGAAMHFLIQLPGILWHRIRWQPSISVRTPDLRRVAKLMAPRIVDLLLAQVTLQWLNVNLASSMDEGRVAAIGYAYTPMNMLWTMIGITIGTAVFPMMSAVAARNDVQAQRSALSGALRAVLALAIPSAMGLIVLGRPIISLLYEGGEFGAESVELVYYALQFYALMLISQSMLDIVVRAYAAQKDTLTPLLVSFFTTALNVGLAIWLSRPMSEGGFEHGGLPLARAIAIGLEVTIDLYILHRRWGGIAASQILLDAGKALLAAGGMAAAILAIRTILDPGPFVMLALGGAVGGVIYLLLALLLGIREVRTLPMALLATFSHRKPGALPASQ